MIRILIIAILAVVLYRMVIGKPILGSGQENRNRHIPHNDGEFTDYEEIDDEDIVK